MAVVIVMMMLAPAALGIGAGFRIEWRVDAADLRAEPRHHVDDHLVPADAQTRAGDLYRQMAIAEMPGDACELRAVAADDLGERLGGGTDGEIAAALELEPVIRPDHDRARQVEKERRAVIAMKADAAAVTVEEAERHRAACV